MDYEAYELEDTPSPLLPTEKQQSTPCFYPTLIQKRLLQPIHTIVLFLPIALIRCLWYSMNRERDPVGVDPLMHPPVALTLIPFSVKLPWRLHIGSAWAIIKDNGAQVKSKLKKKWVVLFYYRPPRPNNTWWLHGWHANVRLIVTKTDQWHLLSS